MRALLGIAIFLAASPAWGFVRTVVESNPVACLFWAPRAVHYLINQKGSSGLPGQPGVDAVEGGFGAWMNQSCSDFAYVDDGPTPSTQVGYNDILVSQPMLSGDIANPHLVIFRDQDCSALVPMGDDCLDPTNDDCDNKYDCWPSDVDTGGDALAYTLVTSDVNTGEILDADTAFDELDFEFKDLTTQQCDSRVDLEHCADLQNTMAHEAGHFLGLAHTPITTATMYGQVVVPLETSKRVLSSDDIDGLCTIYPGGQPTNQCVPDPPSTIVGRGSSCQESDGTSLGGPLVGMWMLARAKRRRPH